MKVFHSIVWALCVSLCAPISARADAMTSGAANLLSNGSFNLRDAKGSFTAWSRLPQNLQETTLTEDGHTLVSLKTADPHVGCALQQVLTLRPEWAKILIRGYVRVTSMLTTPKAAFGQAGAGIGLSWRMKSSGQLVRAASRLKSDPTGGWVEINRILDIPAGADQLIVAPEIVAAAGSADFRELSAIAWVTTFDDEFDGTSIDKSRWTPTDSDNILFQPGWQYFAPDHVTVANGVAKFHAEKAMHENWDYQSGEIRTVDKFQQLYGYWEFRIKIPVVEGTWPAVYLLKWDDAWPPEIDLMECNGKIMQTVFETNHYADDYGRHKGSSVNFPADDLDRSTWHTYAICWEPGALAWYLDDEYKGTTRTPDARIPDMPMYVRFNLAVGAWSGDPAKSSWPQDMECDYVRIYQRSDMPLPVYPAHSMEITLPNNSATLSAISCNPMTGATATWSLAEGPSGATIQNPSAMTTKATFTKPGMYRFNLRIAKGSSMASRDLLVYVNSAGNSQ